MSRLRLIGIGLLGLFVGGCGPPEAQFRLNMAYMRRNEKESAEFTPDQKQDVADILTAMFGTPDEPFLPTGGESRVEDVVDINRLKMAAGPFGSDEDGTPRGLYRQHCVHCHGVSGDGAGPTAAFLNPYPRDYRMGVFKFKTTPKGARPTEADLVRILREGIPGTAMPSFKLLPQNELEALADYVKYLSIRGEVERRLVEDMAIELDEGERLDTSSEFLIEDVLASVTVKWLNAESQVSTVAERPDWSEAENLTSIRRGRDLFYGAIANCVKCHGDSQLGDGQTDDYDDWVKDFEKNITTLTAEERADVTDELVTLGGLRPRNIRPRNLRLGNYRGGRRPVDLYLRILNGIDGSPMPASIVKLDGAPPTAKGLTTEDIWHLVNYVKSLPYEHLYLSQPHDPTFMRDRM